ncbi:MAG TPA: hypothetical protein VEW42_03195, partial [Candidatus Eisenbacteria bacterium]|nr:hypothetical protein [Candidatus Eisenbacteria bacterium]
MIGERRMPTPLPERPQPQHQQPIVRRTEALPAFDYEAHTAQVKAKLRKWQFGPAIETFEAKGLDKSRYIPWAREKLFGKDNANLEHSLPKRIGDVEIPDIIRENAGNMRAILASYNVGYGHYRTALVMENLMQVMGIPTTDLFISGPDRIIDVTKGFWAKILLRDVDRATRGVTTNYIHESLKDAYRQGLMANQPVLHDPDPKYTKKIRNLFGILMGTMKERFTLDLGRAAKRSFELQDQTPGQMRIANLGYKALLAKSTKHLLRTIIEKAEGGKNKKTLVIATHGVTANVIGVIPEKVKQELGIIDANFQPDIGMILATYTANPPTYTEKDITALKWGMKLGMPDGEFAPNTHVLNGYFTPLSSFDRDHLSTARSEAAKNGAPLTVIGTASGVAPAQIEAFKTFITEHAAELRAGTLRYIVQCGNDANGGPEVHRELTRLA